MLLETLDADISQRFTTKVGGQWDVHLAGSVTGVHREPECISLDLDDGTRVHLADIRMGIPGVPVFFGYIQKPGEVHPATALTVTEDVGDHGFPSRARIDITAGDSLGLDVTPVAFGPVVLRNDEDGRVSRFPRALVQCRTDDGRIGAGWIEWNQPETFPPDAIDVS